MYLYLSTDHWVSCSWLLSTHSPTDLEVAHQFCVKSICRGGVRVIRRWELLARTDRPLHCAALRLPHCAHTPPTSPLLVDCKGAYCHAWQQNASWSSLSSPCHRAVKRTGDGERPGTSRALSSSVSGIRRPPDGCTHRGTSRSLAQCYLSLLLPSC